RGGALEQEGVVDPGRAGPLEPHDPARAVAEVLVRPRAGRLGGLLDREPVALAVDAHPDAVHGVREARGEAREDRGTAHERLDPRALLEERVEEGDDLERRRGTLVERPESLQELLHASPFLTSSTRRCDPTRGP